MRFSQKNHGHSFALVDWQKEDKLFENQQLFLTPIVRNGRKATVGYQPDVWKTWE